MPNWPPGLPTASTSLTFQDPRWSGCAPTAPEPPRHPALEALDAIDPDELTPRDALELVYRLKKL